MEILYVPVSKNKPVVFDVKGHRMIILSHDEEALQFELKGLGADGVEAIAVGETQEEQEKTMNRLAQSVKGGVVVAPLNVKIEDLMHSLSQHLPWVH